MSKLFYILLFLALPLSAQINVVPQPNEITYHKGTCPISTKISYIQDKFINNPEGYQLIIKPNQIIIKFATEAGKFYAEQTFNQLVFGAEVTHKKSLPCLTITDAPRFAYRYYDAVSVGATFTAARLWARLRASGLPWDKAKSFDGACSLGTFQTLSEEERKDLSGGIDLSINEQVVQTADLKDMLCSIDDIIAAISRYHKLCQGDLIYCGTPAEGSLVQLDDHIVGRWKNKPLLAFNVK